MPLEILVYGFWGALFGLIFPQAKWKWGLWLNVNFFMIIIFAVPRAHSDDDFDFDDNSDSLPDFLLRCNYFSSKD
jgi:hypothetical protein